LRAAILEGRLRPGARLPATRELAREYGLSRGTVVSAFEQLKAEGYVTGSVGSGTYVNRILPDGLLQVRGKAGASVPTRPRPRAVSEFGLRVSPFPETGFRRARAFRADQPALDLFPTALWAQLAARRLRRATASDLLGCGPMGYRPLREAVADYLSTARGVNCVPEQVAIVSGVQEALDLVARVLVNPGDRVCMENPGYVGASLVFEAHGAKISALRVDAEGMELPGPRLTDARLAYVTPAHQFPLGISMSVARRLALLEWARNSGALILEDDYDSEFRYSGRPLPALQGLDRHGVVLFAGSFSKVMFPSIRLGYLVIPTDLVDSFAATKSVTSRHAPVLEQSVLCDFITAGHFGRHVRRMREQYAERLSVLMESARQRLAGLLEISAIEAGLQTVGWLGHGIDGESAAEAAAAHGVEVTPLSRYSRGNVATTGLQIGFAAVDPAEIRRGVRDLAMALEAELTPSAR
jgi:GntR family transcriptional regulator/MocR family aminotransferase